MSNRPENFYSDYNIFLSEVTKEMKNKKTLSATWLQGINIVLGAGALSSIMSIGLAANIGKSSSNTRSLTTGYALKKKLNALMQQFNIGKEKLTEKEERERIEKARLLYHEFLITLDGDNQKQEIDALFDDLVNGNEILY